MGFKGKVYITDTGTPADPVAFTLAQAASIFTRIVTFFSTAAERVTETAVPSKMSAAEKLGMPAYVDERKALSFWDGDSWEWVPGHTVDVATRAASAQVANTTPLNILANSLVLPPGNRNVEVKAGCNIAAGGTGGWNARAYVVGTNLANGMVGDRALQFTGDVDAMFRSWDLVCSGTVTYTVFGLNSNGTGVCDFTDTWLTIIDHGPA